MEVKRMFFLPGFLDGVLESFEQGDKDVYLVCWAANGLTPLNAMTLGLIEGEYLDDVVNYVNRSNVATTFYPQFRITILPYAKYDEILRENIRRCVRINEEIIKSRFVYFIDESMNDPSFFEILKEAVEEMEDLNFTEKIIC